MRDHGLAHITHRRKITHTHLIDRNQGVDNASATGIPKKFEQLGDLFRLICIDQCSAGCGYGGRITEI